MPTILPGLIPPPPPALLRLMPTVVLQHPFIVRRCTFRVAGRKGENTAGARKRAKQASIIREHAKKKLKALRPRLLEAQFNLAVAEKSIDQQLPGFPGWKGAEEDAGARRAVEKKREIIIEGRRSEIDKLRKILDEIERQIKKFEYAFEYGLYPPAR